MGKKTKHACFTITLAKASPISWRYIQPDTIPLIRLNLGGIDPSKNGYMSGDKMFYWRRYILLILSSTLAKIPVLPYLLCVEHSIYYVTSYAYVCSM